MAAVTWPVGRDHDLGGVLSGRAVREQPEIQKLKHRTSKVRRQT